MGAAAIESKQDDVFGGSEDTAACPVPLSSDLSPSFLFGHR